MMTVPGIIRDTRQSATLAHLLRRRASRQSDQLAYRFCLEEESREEYLTYGALDRRASAIAAALAPLGVAGERVLLVYPPGLEFICAWFACAYAGAVPVATPPPLPARLQLFLSRTAAIAADARPTVALTTTTTLEGLPSPPARPPGLDTLRWLATDAALEQPPHAPDLAVHGDDLAFLQYTSGSTTAPRGVMVTHRNLMDNLCAIQERFWRASDSGSVSWLPPYHDMGLVGGILAPLYVGTPATLMSPLAFVQRPQRWLHAVARFGAAVSGGPNFAYDLCARRITAEQCAGLDLNGWRVAFTGSEPISPGTLHEFAVRFAPYGFRAGAFTPCYGLAEATLLVSAAGTTAGPLTRGVRQHDLERRRVVPCAADDADAHAVVSCGPPVATTRIVDPDSLRPCPEDQVGEIWVSGSNVALGYWRRRDETECTFGASLAGASDGGQRYLRTGDLGFFLEGELFVTGRLKDLIIIDGANHYPQDIERTVGDCHPALLATDCAAFSIDTADGERLIVVAAVRDPNGVAEGQLLRAIRAAVSEQHDLRVHDVVLVKRRGIPKTSSGKVRRHVCRADYLARTLPVCGGWGAA